MALDAVTDTEDAAQYHTIAKFYPRVAEMASTKLDLATLAVAS
ncbi:hypothetical protein AB0N88_04890 [Streptomyces sp. NPDC093516]